jgi:hypothetical protein
MAYKSTAVAVLFVLGIRLQFRCVLKCTVKCIRKISDLHITNSMELSITQDAISCATIQEIPSILWNPAGRSLPHLQELSTCPYPETDQSSIYPSFQDQS